MWIPGKRLSKDVGGSFDTKTRRLRRAIFAPPARNSRYRQHSWSS
jgi:hypothetical protein